EAVELASMAGLALVIGKLGEIVVFAAVFLVAGGALQLNVALGRPAEEQRTQGEQHRRGVGVVGLRLARECRAFVRGKAMRLERGGTELVAVQAESAILGAECRVPGVECRLGRDAGDARAGEHSMTAFTGQFLHAVMRSQVARGGDS